MLRKVVVHYTRKHENVKTEILVMISNFSIFKNKTSNLQGTNTISKIHIYSKNNSCIGRIRTIYYNNLQNKVLKIHSYEIAIFGQMDMQSFSKTITL
jgi:hypothetical protein